METPQDAGTKVCSNGFGHMTKMAATPIYGKYPLKNLLQSQKTDDIGTWYVALGGRAYKVCSKNDPRLTYLLNVKVKFAS